MPVETPAGTLQSPPASLPTRSEPRTRSWTPWFLPVAVLATIALRYTSLLSPLTNDEAGFLLVSRAWVPTPDNMYGTFWVDRPPILIWTYQAADVLFGAYGPRVFASLLAIAMVVAVYQTGVRVAGESAARWATAGTVILASNPALQSWTGKGEMLGTPLVVISCCLSIAALRRRHDWRRVALSGAAGFVAVLACGLKQSLVGGLVFGAALLGGAMVSRRLRPSEGLTLGVAAIAGAAVPVLATVAWALSNNVELGTVWHHVYGFRSEASAVIAQGQLSAPRERAVTLAVLAVVTGIVPIMVWLASCLPALRARFSVGFMAVATMFAVDVIGAILGGSYWQAYLIPLIPSAAFALMLLFTLTGWRRRVSQGLVVVAAVATVCALTTFTVDRVSGHSGTASFNTGAAIARSSQPTDTIVSLYGDADTVQASGLRSPYPYLWSLPVRTLDPDLSLLKRQLTGPDAPTWVVAALPLNSWNIDASGELQAVLDTKYIEVADDCGDPVWRRIDRPRPPIEIDCHRPWRPILRALSFGGR